MRIEVTTVVMVFENNLLTFFLWLGLFNQMLSLVTKKSSSVGHRVRTDFTNLLNERDPCCS